VSTRRPIVTLDLDGVICSPPFGINLGISRAFLDPAVPPRPARVPARWWSVPFDHARFDLRRPLPGVASALAEVHALREVVLLTGRRTSPVPWLRRYGLDVHIDRVVINETALRSPHFKLEAIEQIGAIEHVDDDGRTAQLIAERAVARVYLCDWPRNRGPRYHERVTRVANLAAYALLARAEASS
jgi:hypothetical protein